MKGQTNEDPQYIDLHGYTTGILKKNANHCIFYFNDYKYGQLVCVAERDCILYYEVMKGTEYHLKVVLKGLSFTKPNGIRRTINTLVIKKAYGRQTKDINLKEKSLEK